MCGDSYIHAFRRKWTQGWLGYAFRDDWQSWVQKYDAIEDSQTVPIKCAIKGKHRESEDPNDMTPLYDLDFAE